MSFDPSFSYFLDIVRKVSLETQNELSSGLSYLEELDKLFMDWIPEAGCVRPPVAAVLATNAHATFRAALTLSLSGQILPVYMNLRGSIESVLYANAMVLNPDLQSIWISREKDVESRDACKRAFTTRKIFKALSDAHNEVFSKEVEDAYGSTIDFGAHPNSRLLMNVAINSGESANSVDFSYVHGCHSLELKQALVACADVGYIVFLMALILNSNHPKAEVLNQEAVVLRSRLPEFLTSLGVGHPAISQQ